MEQKICTWIRHNHQIPPQKQHPVKVVVNDGDNMHPAVLEEFRCGTSTLWFSYFARSLQKDHRKN